MGNFNINRNVTVTGAGMASSIVRGPGTGRVLNIGNFGTMPMVTLRRLRVTNGPDGGQGLLGGGISLEFGTTLTLDDAEVSGNTADLGGGLFLNNATLNLKGASRIANNYSLRGGGFFSQLSTINLTGTSEVADNTAELGGGGFRVESGGTITLRGQSSIRNNTAVSGNGGGSDIQDATMTLWDQSSIDNNKALAGKGGGSFLIGSTIVELREASQLTNNKADPNGENGGGIYVQTGSATRFGNDVILQGNDPDDCASSSGDLCFGF